MPCDISHSQWEKESGEDRKLTILSCTCCSSTLVSVEEKKNSDDIVSEAINLHLDQTKESFILASHF